MSTHYYAFGSICRGEMDRYSDVDLLACITGAGPDIDTEKFSVYQHARLVQLWAEGNPFAWHLHLESRLLFASDGIDFLASLGIPETYRAASGDCEKFAQLFKESASQLEQSGVSATFNLSCMFLSIRNFATCYSLSRGCPVFSRWSPMLIDTPLNLDRDIFDIFMRARVLSTRGVGVALGREEVMLALSACSAVQVWMSQLLAEVR